MFAGGDGFDCCRGSAVRRERPVNYDEMAERVEAAMFGVSKLKDRGTQQAYGRVTTAQEFMHLLRFYVDNCRSR